MLPQRASELRVLGRFQVNFKVNGSGLMVLES